MQAPPPRHFQPEFILQLVRTKRYQEGHPGANKSSAPSRICWRLGGTLVHPDQGGPSVKGDAPRPETRSQKRWSSLSAVNGVKKGTSLALQPVP